MALPSHADLKTIISYNPDTGVFTWIASKSRVKAGDIAGCSSGNGYWRIKIDQTPVLAHRLAWFYMTGEWPYSEIDHANRMRNDNRWSNLRAATTCQNRYNAPIDARNASGVKGIYFNKAAKKWQASIRYDGARRYLGLFESLSDAEEFVGLARDMVHGEFACHG